MNKPQRRDENRLICYLFLFRFSHNQEAKRKDQKLKRKSISAKDLDRDAALQFRQFMQSIGIFWITDREKSTTLPIAKIRDGEDL